MRRGWAVIVLLALSACVAPARTFDSYEAKAASTAESVASAVETARLAVSAAAQGRAFAPYLSVVLAEAERDAAGSRAVFAAIQPPDERSAQLRSQVLDLMGGAEDVLAGLRIAVRWGELDRLPAVAAPLSSLGQRLTALAEAHS
jgi:hypothetical protein